MRIAGMIRRDKAFIGMLLEEKSATGYRFDASAPWEKTIALSRREFPECGTGLLEMD
jgi:hypothetical protein